MTKLLVLFLSLILINPAYAEDEASEAMASTTEEISNENQNTNSAEFFQKIEAEKASAENESDVEIIRQVEQKEFALPDCNDNMLYNKTKEFINSYFEKIGSQGTLYRRRHYFVINSLDRFTQEDVAAYKNSSKQVVANAIANIEVNYALTDENIRLCKNTGQNRYVKDIYLLIFPQSGQTKAHDPLSNFVHTALT